MPQPQGWEGAAPQAQPQPQPYAEPPLLLGRYRVVETRGTGGFATVHVCWDVRLQRRVAIKCMPLAAAPGTSTSTLQEALDEARITSRLTHPNIVTVHDFEVTQDTAYLIMEYVDGLTLAELMARVEGGVLTYDECAHLLSCLANALAYAHENGVLHLDIKPSNVFIDTSANVKLGDFGMASLASAAGWEGARGGTIGYMPPEQLEGGLVDERTDVFALAVVCYQALTGTSPFAAKDAEASLKKIARGAKQLGKIESELAGPVTEGIGRALAADPAAREATVGELADSVLPYLGDEQAGKDSVAELMAQATGETGPDEDTWEQAARVRATERWPWLPSVVTRGVNALACGIVGWKLGPVIAQALAASSANGSGEPGAGLTLASVAALAVCGGLAAAMPGAGTALTCGVVVAAVLACGIYSPAFLVALVVAVLTGFWWLNTNGRSWLAGASLLLPAALGVPTVGAGLAGRVLPPACALGTSALGVGLQVIVGLAPAASNGDAFARACATIFTEPATWAMIVCAGAASGIVSLLSYGRGPVVGVSAQVIAAVILICARTTMPGMENAGLWFGEKAPTIALAVVCAVLMSIAIVILGPTPKPREDE